MPVYRRPKGSTAAVLERMDVRVESLCKGFRAHLASFERSNLFSGPSWYFHRKTLALRRQHASLGTLFEDDAYFDALYATLAAWGLHRMGGGRNKTRLLELDEIKTSLRERREPLEGLAALSITGLAEERHGEVVTAVWDVLPHLRVSVADAVIVANSKLLHHVLPDLVPPIDRQYTFRFFYGRMGLSIDEEGAFREMFGRLLRIGVRNRAAIEEAGAGGAWNTSPSKVVDNAVVGFLLSQSPRRKLSRPDHPPR